MRMRLALPLIAAGALLVGYISNVLTYKTAIEKTKTYLERTLENERPSKGKPINWVAEANVHLVTDQFIEEINKINFLGFKMNQPWFHPNKEYMPKPYSTNYPWAYVKVRRWDLPFMVFTYYGWEAAGLWGRGGVKLYLCLFGYPIEIHDYRIWVT